MGVDNPDGHNVDSIAGSLSREQAHFLVYNSTNMMHLGEESTPSPRTVEIAESLEAQSLITIGTDKRGFVTLTRLGALVAGKLRGGDVAPRNAPEGVVLREGAYHEIGRDDEADTDPGLPRVSDVSEIVGILTDEYAGFLKTHEGFVLDRTDSRLVMIAQFFINKGVIRLTERDQVVLTGFGRVVLGEVLKKFPS